MITDKSKVMVLGMVEESVFVTMSCDKNQLEDVLEFKYFELWLNELGTDRMKYCRKLSSGRKVEQSQIPL